MKKMKLSIDEFLSLEGSLFKYSLSYCFLLALLPSLIIALFLFQNSILGVSDLLGFLYHFLPQDLIQPFVEYIMDKDYHTLISLMLSLIIATYVASKSFYSFMLISAAHEKFSTYKILIRVKSIVLFFVFGLSILGIAIVSQLLNINIFLTFLIGLFFIFYLFYRSLSFSKSSLLYGMIGAFFSSIAISMVGVLFFYIVSEFTSYQNIYGPLSSLVVLLLSIYVISSIIYFGYCLNLVYGMNLLNKEYKSIWFYKNGECIITKFKKVFLRRGD